MAVFLLRPTLSSLATPVLLRLLCSWRMREEPTHAFKQAKRERERELPQANPRLICEQLSALWRVLETVLHGAFSLWFIFPDFSTRRFCFYSHFGVLFHRIFFFPEVFWGGLRLCPRLDFVVFLCHSYGSASILACFSPRALIAMFFAFHVNSLVSQTCRSWDAFVSSSRRSDLVTHSCS